MTRFQSQTPHVCSALNSKRSLYTIFLGFILLTKDTSVLLSLNLLRTLWLWWCLPRWCVCFYRVGLVLTPLPLQNPWEGSVLLTLSPATSLPAPSPGWVYLVAWASDSQGHFSPLIFTLLRVEIHKWLRVSLWPSKSLKNWNGYASSFRLQAWPLQAPLAQFTMATLNLLKFLDWK